MIERRQYQRFHVEDGVYAFLSHDSQKLGEVIDIGRGGMSFSYKDIVDLTWIPSNDPVAQWSGVGVRSKSHTATCYELSFFFDDIDMVKQLPPLFKARLVRERPLQGTGHFTKTVRCSVEFLNPTGYQEEWLHYFIHNHTLRLP